MASRPNPPSGPKTRRPPPPPPVFPGNWIWLLLIGMLLAVVVFQGLGSNGTVDYSEFWKLLNNDEQVKHLKVVTVVGSERIYGELDSSEGLSAEFKDKLVKWPWNERMHFWTIKPPLEDQGTLINRLNKLAVEDGLVVNRQEDYLGWLGPALLMFLPVVLLIAFFVLVILPRLRDPLGGG